MIAPEQIEDINARADCADLARSFGAELRRSGRVLIGSCPLCGGGKKATRFEVEGRKWVCAVCARGGDAIALVRAAKGCDFRAAVEFLGGPRDLSDAERAKIAAMRAAREKKEAEDQARVRAAEIERCRAIWRTAALGDLSDVYAYLRGRGLDVPQPFFGRAVNVMPYYHGTDAPASGASAALAPSHERGRPRAIHRGPAMLAPLVSPEGAFCGIHVTWIDPERPGRKAAIVDPDTGESLPAKKMRGAAGAAHIRLAKCARPVRLFIGEGIETVLSARMFLARAGLLRETDAFWAAGSLGNLGGPHKGTVAHPTLKSAAGNPLRVPGDAPDLERPSIPLPATVEEVVLLGDGDSDAFTTRLALARGVARHAARGVKARSVFAEAGGDFNDMWRRAWA